MSAARSVILQRRQPADYTMATTAADKLLDREPMLREIVRRIVDAYHPLRIYIFGSKARGDSGADSDYDLLVVVKDEAPADLRQSRLAYQSLWGTGTAADVLVCTDGYFRSRVQVKTSLPATVEREGKLLYGV
jgi:predicted nucleotidyltransferase